ncbi:dephospho-CoA kinase [Eubacterium sp. 14-2]|uniref:dephospho-CoA kinase n=1 Tax=Eubacterium sp. 14-2 TaxID=1235790 RepID=UPI000340F63F|nr:dephospho-CoA kinase [Eubacterium sp. 14-2]EOT24229.1 dephospho-CoA kinase [Eubacterium sp. 14-2]
MQVIGITGGVGAGKSAILEYLEQNYRVKNLIADKIARMMMEPGSECYRKLLKFLPVEVYNEDESINRSALAAAIFTSEDLRKRVNDVMHPVVKEYILAQIEEQKRMGLLDFVVIEAALLIEDNYDEICDELWYVRTSEEVRKKRLMRSRGYTQEQVEQMFASQLSDEEYRKNCQVIIENNGTREETFYQVAQAIKEKGELNKMEQQLDGVPLVFGLDIGTRNVVGTVGYKEDDDFYVVAQYVKEHATRSMLDGQIHDIGRVGRTINEVKKELEEQSRLSLNEVCIAAAGRVLKTVTTTVEYSFPEEIVVTGEDVHTLDLLGIEKAQQILNENNDTNFKFYCVGYSVVKYYLNGDIFSNLEGHKAEVISADIIVTFLPEDVVDGLYSAVGLAGLKVASLTLEPIAAINVAIPETFRMLNIALVDVGAGTSDISVTRDGSIIAYGMIPCAGDEITELLVQHYLVDFKTAEHIKLSSTTEKEIEYQDIMMIKHTVTAEEVWDLIQPLVYNLTEDIAAKIKELNGGETVSATFVVGGGGKVHGFVEHLAEELELPLERVALRGEEVLQEIHFEQQDIRKDPLLVTPIGICISYYDQKNNFVFVRFNGERIKLYDNNKLTIVDAALRAGFPNEQLFPRRGREINFYVNGKKRIVRGEPGESAVVRVNGRVTSINATLEPNSDIVIEPSTMGEAAVCRLEELEEYGRVVITFEVNGRMITCPRFAEVNGSLEPPYYEIQENDWVEMRNFYTVAQIMEFMDVEIDMDSEILVNNKPADLDTMVYENFSVEWDVITYRTPPSEIENVYKRSEPLVMEEEAVSEPEPAEEPKPVKEEEAKVQPQPEPVKAEEPKPQPKPVKEEAKKTQPQPEPIKAEEPKPQPKPVKEEEAKAQSQPEPVKAEEPESLTEEPELSQEELEEKFIQSQQTAESDIRPTVIKKPEVKTVKAKPETVSLQVIVNNAAVTLTGKSSYVFVDVFDAISFDLNAGNGRAIVTRLNNAMPSYTAPLQYGDVIEIYWED